MSVLSVHFDLKVRIAAWWWQRVVVHSAGYDFSTKLVRHGWRQNVVVVWIGKTCIFATEREQYVVGSAFAVLGYDDLCLAVQIVSFFVLKYSVVFRSMHKEHQVGILLNGSRLAQVAQLRAFALYAIALLHRTVQLRESQHWYVQFFRQSF